MSVLLSACFSDDKKAQAEQLAQMQAKLDEQERQNKLMQAQAKEEQERLRYEEELRKAKEEARLEAEEALKAKLATEPVAQPRPSQKTYLNLPNGKFNVFFLLHRLLPLPLG